ncbi:transactivator protein [Hybanthus yellow mosaic virus]|uniref:Transcriptional activator protein n=1 Tax=Hybanthus yellow mosaic virus TaxID=1884874 RepID=A0A6J3U7A3_9GEMI|nr:transactivator protein [Hybanthus yellow mosaic virus]ANY43201.1 transactivator protein [Hybanthus yellow mosaic virus]
MRSSSPCTPPSIKKKHREAKKRAVRRRRIDLECGCSIYFHIGCTGHGFTHRGTHHCTSGREWRVYLGDRKSPIFRDHVGCGAQQSEEVPVPNTIQPQPQEEAGSSQVLAEPDDLDTISLEQYQFLQDILFED